MQSAIIIDFLTIGFLTGCVLFGAYWGAIRIFFSIAAIMIGSYLAARFYSFTLESVDANSWIILFAFSLIFIVTSAIVLFIGRFISAFVKKILLRPADRIIGGVLLFLFACVLIAYGYGALKALSPRSPARYAMGASRIVPKIARGNGAIYNKLPSFLQDRLDTFKVHRKIAQVKKDVEKNIEEKEEALTGYLNSTL